jgi:threonine dehydrogenase-like Zn-dependent dehydrogenase
MVVHAAPVTLATVAVAIDVGKNEFAVSVTDAARARLLKPLLGCAMTAPAVHEVIVKITRLLPSGAAVKVGIEAAGHYHLPLLAAAVWPAGWELLELNPGHVTEQRKAARCRPPTVTHPAAMRSRSAEPAPLPAPATVGLTSAPLRPMGRQTAPTTKGPAATWTR